MKILQLVQKPQRRGAEVFAFQLCRQLGREGNKVRIVYLYPHTGAGALPLQPYDYILPGQESHFLERFPGINPHLLRCLQGIINDFQPDIVQVNGARTVKYGALARYLNSKKRWSLIYRNIGQPRDWVQGWQRTLFYQKLVMPQVNGLVGVSQTTLQATKEFYALSIPTIHIPNGIDAALTPMTSPEAVRRSTHTPRQAPVLLYVGSLTPEKRLDRLFRLTRQVADCIPDVYLWLVGDGPLRSALEQQVEALALADRVRFLGVQTDVAAYMNAADLFVLTSDTEGIPAVILEAGLLGLPVVATRVGGLPECVIEGETGLLVEPRHEDQLAQRICDLIRDPARRCYMGQSAKDWIRGTFTMDKIAKRYEAFYQEVLAN